MSEMSTPPFPERHPGRFQRLWMEFEVEVTDEMALKTSNLELAGDGQGNVIGLEDMDVYERIGLALSRVAQDAWRAAAEDIGIRVLGASGPSVRYLDETGEFAEIPLGPMPVRRDDGGYAPRAPRPSDD